MIDSLSAGTFPTDGDSYLRVVNIAALAQLLKLMQLPKESVPLDISRYRATFTEMTTNLYRDTPPFTVAVDLDRGDDPQPSTRCFATELPANLAVDLIADWATWQYGQSLSVRTVTERASAVKRCAQHTGTAPEFLQPQQIAEWLANDEWSARTRVTYYLALSAWFRWLATMGHRPVNPMERVGKPRQPRTVPRPITDANLRRLLGVLMRRRTRAMILLAALQGLRAHEIAKVKAEDFDLVDRTLTVKGKGGVVATLPLHHLVVEHAYLMPRTGHWFPGSDQGYQRRESVCQMIKQAMVRAGARVWRVPRGRCCLGIDGPGRQRRRTCPTSLQAASRRNCLRDGC